MLSSLRRERFRLLAPDWYELKYGIPSADAARHYRREGYRLGYAPTPLFDVEWYEALYGRGDGPPLASFERRAVVAAAEPLARSGDARRRRAWPRMTCSSVSRLHGSTSVIRAR